MTPERIIGESIDRLAADYDLALIQAAGDESIVTLFLPAEWAILARRICELITVEVTKRYEADQQRPPRPGRLRCTCGASVFRVNYDPSTLLRSLECCGCGGVSHV